MVIVMTRSRAGFFPFHAAFPDFAPGRRPHHSFRGLLELYTRYGPPDCLPTICELCREVSISPVTRTHRSPAIESNHQLFEWVLPPLVFSPLGAHAKPPVPPRRISNLQMSELLPPVCLALLHHQLRQRAGDAELPGAARELQQEAAVILHGAPSDEQVGSYLKLQFSQAEPRALQ